MVRLGVTVQIGIALRGLNHRGGAVMAGSQEGDSGGGQNGATGQQTKAPNASMTPQQRAAAAALRVARKAPVLSRRMWFAALVRCSDPHSQIVGKCSSDPLPSQSIHQTSTNYTSAFRWV